jgi:hypothetical protein
MIEFISYINVAATVFLLTLYIWSCNAKNIYDSQALYSACKYAAIAYFIILGAMFFVIIDLNWVLKLVRWLF